MALQWPGRFKQRKQLNHNRKLTSVTVNNSKASSEKDDELKVPTAALHTLSIHPKQFVLSSHQDDVAMDLERCSPNGSTIEPPDEALPEHRVEEMKRAWEELQGFSDLDYMLPHHLDQLLRQEGVDDGVVDNTVAMGKLRHDRANYLNRLYHVKRRLDVPLFWLIPSNIAETKLKDFICLTIISALGGAFASKERSLCLFDWQSVLLISRST